MKNYFLVIALVLFYNTQAQNVGIGTNTPAPSAILELQATNRGFLLPRLTTAQRNAIPAPAEGLMVFDTDARDIFMYKNATWQSMAPSGTGWGLSGNAGTVATNFVGTTDGQPLRFRVNNIPAGFISPLASGNIALGRNALLNSSSTSSWNIAIGNAALAANTSGEANIAVGDNVLSNNNSGHDNIAIGWQSMKNNLTATGNVGFGTLSLADNTSGQFNSAIGTQAMEKSLSGDRNTALGYYALYRNQSSQNVSIGALTMINNTTGFSNTAVGYIAMEKNTTGTWNAAFGALALSKNTTGEHNTALGYDALRENETGGYNTSAGFRSLYLNLSGKYNTAIGYEAMYFNTKGNNNTVIGRGAQIPPSDSLENASAIGARAYVTQHHSMVLGSIKNVNGAEASVKVGIGTTAPNTALHIAGGTAATLAANSGYFTIGLTTARNLVLDSTAILARNNNASSELRIQSINGAGNTIINTLSGSTGIGTDLPNSKLHISGGTMATLAAGTGYITIGAANARNLVFDSTTILAREGFSHAALNIQSTMGAGNTILNTLSGNTGIGIDLPGSKLHVAGGSAATFAANTGHFTLGLTGGRNLVFDNTTILARNNNASSDLHIQSINGAGNTLINTLSGRTGIGLADPDTKLHVAGGSNAGLSNNSGFLVIGPTHATNLVFDARTILARNAGAAANLFLNPQSGSVVSHRDGAVPVTQGPPPVIGAGRRMMWYVDKAAFRAGYVAGSQWDAANVGLYSLASGFDAMANGFASVALGQAVESSGQHSIAMGRRVKAGGNGSFVIGDSDPHNRLVSETVSNNIFWARFNGGFYLISSNQTAQIGVQVTPGSNSWSAISDAKLKENFLPVNGEQVLKNIAAMPQYTWNYKGQDPKSFRHYGPMAQDFFKAFGNDDIGTIGCDTLINQHDFLGVSLVAIQALEKRTADLNDRLEKTLIELIEAKKEIEELKKVNKK